MKFRSPNKDEDLMIGVRSGHTFVVSKDGCDVPDRFVKAAIDAGCVPLRGRGKAMQDIATGDEPEPGTGERTAAVREAMEKMLDGDGSDDFGQDGKPNCGPLSKIAGFNVGREERDTVWAQLKVELELGTEDE